MQVVSAPTSKLFEDQLYFKIKDFLLIGITVTISCPSFCLVYKLSIVSTVDIETIVSTTLVSFNRQVLFVVIKI